jgi:hypothetical protein
VQGNGFGAFGLIVGEEYLCQVPVGGCDAEWIVGGFGGADGSIGRQEG